MNDIWANTSRLLSLELCTEEMLVTYQQAMCESKKFQHVRTCTLIAFVRLYIFTISKPPAPRLIAAPAMTQVTIRKNACHFIPPPGGRKRSSISGSKRKTRIQNKPSIHENMKIRFTIVSIKKHWATVCTVESSLNYRRVTHEAKKKQKLSSGLQLDVGAVGPTHSTHSPSLSILAHIHSLFLSLWTLISWLEFKKKKRRSLKTKPTKGGQTCLHLSDKR